MARHLWLGLALAGCGLIAPLASAQERVVPPPPNSTSGLTPSRQVEPGVKSTEGSTIAPKESESVVIGDDYQPTFSERMAGFRDVIFRPISFSWFTDLAGANGNILPGDIEDPYWVKAEMLFGWFKKGNAPPLLTTGTPQSSLGVLGADGTQVLYGGSIDMLMHLGGKITAGMWLEPAQTWGFEGNYFFLGGRKSYILINSQGDPLLAAPYIDAVNNQQSSFPIAHEAIPDLDLGKLTGFVNIGWSSQIQGAEFNNVHNLVRGTRGRVDWTWGYRYLRLDESLYTDFQTSEEPPAGQQFGAQTHTFDLFDTENEFQGINFGLRSQWWWGCWSFDVNGKLAFGAIRGTVQVFGQTQSAAPPQFQVITRSGGVYALASNIGDESATRFSFVPEVELGVGYQFSDHLRLTANYNILAITNVVRPGDQIDTRINPNILDGNSGNPAVPVRFNNTSTFWMQTLSFGFEYRY